MQNVESVVAALRAGGSRITPQREAILRVLVGNEQHPTMEAIHDAVTATMPTVSLKTVYQTVHELETLGAVQVLDLGTGSVRVDPNVEAAHHHLVCRSCGSVRDLPVAFPEVQLPEAWRAQFRVDEIQIVFRGACEQCR
jgi:Fe2+ or Zn2+ uptake regulation protein